MVAIKEILDFPISQKVKVPSRLLYKNSSMPNSFQQAMRPALLLMQVFALFPAQGITAPTYRSLKFKWISWRVFLNAIFLFGSIFRFIIYCVNTKIDKILVINAIMFMLECIILQALYVYLAMQWPEFVKEWHLVEVSMKNYELSVNVKRKIILIMTSILTLALIEHTMVAGRAFILAKKEEPSANSLEIIRKVYANQTYEDVFYYIPYSIWLGIYFQFITIQQTFIWTFIDVFIAVVSICFHFKLQQISRRLKYMSNIEVSDENIWRNIRGDYVKLSRLCGLVNKQLCWFIIISFFANIYHILSQLFSSLRPMEDTFHKIYFYVSFFLLILRVITVCVFGGSIYDEHEHIMRILTTVPSSVYNTEVERFVIHLSTCETALTGKAFFKITRNLILKVTSAIVTYELVLIQFNQQEFKTKDL